MRLAAAFSVCLATLALAAPPAAADEAPLAVPPAYMDSVTPTPASSAQARNAELAVVRVAADASRLQAVRPRESAPVAPSAGIPEPTGGAALLCGLLAVAFIARRKTSWPEG